MIGDPPFWHTDEWRAEQVSRLVAAGHTLLTADRTVERLIRRYDGEDERDRGYDSLSGWGER